MSGSGDDGEGGAWAEGDERAGDGDGVAGRESLTCNDESGACVGGVGGAGEGEDWD